MAVLCGNSGEVRKHQRAVHFAVPFTHCSTHCSKPCPTDDLLAWCAVERWAGGLQHYAVLLVHCGAERVHDVTSAALGMCTGPFRQTDTISRLSTATPSAPALAWQAPPMPACAYSRCIQTKHHHHFFPTSHYPHLVQPVLHFHLCASVPLVCSVSCLLMCLISLLFCSSGVLDQVWLLPHPPPLLP
jgi:hypothetical protein